MVREHAWFRIRVVALNPGEDRRLALSETTAQNYELRDPDVRLMLQVRDDNAAAFEELVLRYQGRLVTVLEQLVHQRDVAEDLAQEVFLRVFRARKTYTPGAKFSTWLFTIAYRLCLNHIRRRKSLTGDVDFTGIANDEPDTVERVAESEEARRLKDQIWSAVDELSGPQKAAIKSARVNLKTVLAILSLLLVCCS